MQEHRNQRAVIDVFSSYVHSCSSCRFWLTTKSKAAPLLLLLSFCDNVVIWSVPKRPWKKGVLESSSWVLLCSPTWENANKTLQICTRSYFLHIWLITTAFTSKKPTRTAACLRVFRYFWPINALFTQKPISNSCRMISAACLRVALSFYNTPSNWLWTLSEYTQQNIRLPPNGLDPCWGGPKALYSNKSLFLVASKTPTWGWWDSAALRLQLTLPAAMETLSCLTQWRKRRPYKSSHVQVVQSLHQAL